MTAMSPMPWVVIGIPTFNRSSSLGRAIESALAQDYPNVRVLVSDNASTDSTAQVCEGYAAANERISCFRHAWNVGASQNFNSVLERADGELFMWLADDDWLEPGYVSRCVAALMARPDAVLAGARARYYEDGKLKSEGATVCCLAERAPWRVLQFYRQVEENAIFYGVMRSAVARRLRLLNCPGNDWLFVAALAYLGKVETVDGVFVHRTLGGASASRRRIIRALGLPAWQAYVPLTLLLAHNAARDVGWRAPVYTGMKAPGRRVFAVLLWAWICVIKPAQELRRRLSRR